MARRPITSMRQGSGELYGIILQPVNALGMEDTDNVATSSTDLIIPIGILLWIFLTQFSVFFILLWKGGSFHRISWSSIFGLVTSVGSLVFGVTQQPILWVYDNQTTTFVNAYMVPQTSLVGVDLYLWLWVFEIFLVIVACLKLMLDTDLLGGGDE